MARACSRDSANIPHYFFISNYLYMPQIPACCSQSHICQSVVQFTILQLAFCKFKHWHFADDIFKLIFINVNHCILIQMSLKFSPTGPINNVQALVQMTWEWTCEKPLSESMMAGFTNPYSHHFVLMVKLYLIMFCNLIKMGPVTSVANSLSEKTESLILPHKDTHQCSGW